MNCFIKASVRFKFFIFVNLFFCLSCDPVYTYKSISDDPMQIRIYTLDNGLKVYMSVNKAVPRIQATVAVRTGSKDDPPDAQGTANLLRNLLFQGATTFGTKDFPAEKALLDEIEELTEQFCTTYNEQQRFILYQRIDSLSQLASHYAILDDYKCLMNIIEAHDIKSFIDFDQTVFEEDIPANQLENWVKIQYERFSRPVFRLFYSELEAVCEEYNKNATDFSRMDDTLMALLFSDHPYGTHPVVGTSEYLKNPSISHLKSFFKKHYVPDNMAIILSGDFKPSQAIKIIDKYFGNLACRGESVYSQNEIKQRNKHIEKEILGHDIAAIAVGWIFPAFGDSAYLVSNVLKYMISNGKNGIFDNSFNNDLQKPEMFVHYRNYADCGVFEIEAASAEYRKLEEAKQYIFSLIEQLKQGEFSYLLFRTAIEKVETEISKNMTNNQYRNKAMLKSFVYNVDWKYFTELDSKISKITKHDLLKFANEYLTNGYVCINKLQDKDFYFEKIVIPPHLPVETEENWDSDMMVDIKQSILQESKKIK